MTGTRAQAAERRLEIAVAIEAGVILHTVAKRYGVSTVYCRQIAKAAGVPILTRQMAGRLRRMAVIRECHSLEQPQGHIAQLLGVSAPDVSRLSRAMGLRFSKTWGQRNGQRLPNKSRAEVMAALYREGYTLKKIGAQFGITRERVRQILGKYKGMKGSDGGQHIAAGRNRLKRQAARDERFLKKYGCTYAQWAYLCDVGTRMMAAGSKRSRTPLGAFRCQQNNAGHRGIGWELTLWQWWGIWQQSGHWEHRGRGQGYCMCRKGDAGPYAIDNVFIAPAAQNSRDGAMPKRKDPSLPIGVTRTASGKYHAKRHLNGKPLSLGVHPTPELAHAAYLMAGEQRQAA